MSKLPESQGNAPGRRASQPPGKAVIYALLVFNGATLYYIEQFIDEQCVIYGGHLGSLCFYALVIKAERKNITVVMFWHMLPTLTLHSIIQCKQNEGCDI